MDTTWHVIRYSAAYTRHVVGVPCIGEEEDNVVCSIPVEVSEELFDAELKHDCQPGIDWLQQDTDAMDLLVRSNAVQDLLEVLLVLLNAPEIKKIGP